MYLNKIKIQKHIKQFKNRRANKVIFNSKLYHQDNKKIVAHKFSYIFSVLKLFLEIKIYTFFLRKIRRISRRRKFKAFVNFCCNHCFSRKSKNSRMGKGKGKFVRFVYRSISLKPLFSVRGISKIRIIRFTQYLNKKTKNKFICF